MWAQMFLLGMLGVAIYFIRKGEWRNRNFWPPNDYAYGMGYYRLGFLLLAMFVTGEIVYLIY